MNRYKVASIAEVVVVNYEVSVETVTIAVVAFIALQFGFVKDESLQMKPLYVLNELAGSCHHD